jgi:hypothetical protein
MSERAMMDFYESRGWPRDHKLAWWCCVERAKQEIIEDVERGLVPIDAPTFAELHDYADANCYGWGFEDGMPDFDDDDFCAFCNRMQDALARWIEAGGLAGAVGALHQGG